MDWNLKTIGILTALLFGGYFIGLLEAAIRQRGRDKKKNRSGAAIEQALAGTQPPFFSLNQDETGGLVMTLHGQTLTNLDQATPENRRMLSALLEEMQTALETPAAAGLPPPAGEPAASPLPAAPGTAPRRAPPAPVKSDAVKTSMVAQIDEILQKRLAGTPLAEKGIHLQEALTGEVLVFVGLQRYEGIAAVPDADIQAAIRASVSEWEKKV